MLNQEDNELNNKNKIGLGNVLRLLRIARDMQTKELAARMNVSSTYISEVESNNKKPSLNTLSKYSEALDVSKSTILYFEEESKKKGYNNQRLLFEILKKIIETEQVHQNEAYFTSLVLFGDGLIW